MLTVGTLAPSESGDFRGCRHRGSREIEDVGEVASINAPNNPLRARQSRDAGDLKPKGSAKPRGVSQKTASKLEARRKMNNG
jgi:hypothetical protein